MLITRETTMLNCVQLARWVLRLKYNQKTTSRDRIDGTRIMSNRGKCEEVRFKYNRQIFKVTKLSICDCFFLDTVSPPSIFTHSLRPRVRLLLLLIDSNNYEPIATARR
jgi:hypothetical protein